MKKIAYHVPTKEAWEKIVQKWLDEGTCWNEGQETTMVGYWGKYKENSCVSLENEKIHYDPKQWYSEKNYLIMPYKTNDPETWEAGDIIQDEDGWYRTVFIAQGTGDIRTFDLSYKHDSLDSDDLKKYYSSLTAFELKEDGYTLYTLEEEKTKPAYTPDEAIDKLRELGHDCEIKK